MRKIINDGVDRKVLKWFGYVERFSEERLNRRVYESQEGIRDRGYWSVNDVEVIYYRGLKFVPLGSKTLVILQSVHKLKLNLSSCFFFSKLDYSKT